MCFSAVTMAPSLALVAVDIAYEATTTNGNSSSCSLSTPGYKRAANNPPS